MAAIAYTKKVLLQRIRKDISNSMFAKDDFSVSDNELLLYIDAAAAAKIVGSAYMGAKIDGALVVNEAYLITYQLPALTQDDATGYWVAILPQPPLGLPLGYSINRAYFASPGSGVSQEIILIKAKRVGYRKNLPTMAGIQGWVENNRFLLQATNGQPLLGVQLYVQMPSARTTDVNAVMNMPEDDIEFVFNDVIKQLARRFGMPQDIIKDDLPVGPKTS
jgi:hypothetical protein